MDIDFLRRMMGRLDWAAFVQARRAPFPGQARPRAQACPGTPLRPACEPPLPERFPQGARDVGYAELPEAADADMLEDEAFARRFHHALLELHVMEGALVCPESGRKFVVHKGVPNMKLNEDEV